MDEEQLELPTNQLEYRPSFQRRERDKTNWVTTTSQTTTEPLEAQDEQPVIGGGLVADIIGVSDAIQKDLAEKIKELEQKWNNKKFIIEEKFKTDIIRAKTELGLSGDELTFPDYKKALENIKTPAGEFLVEVIEDQIEDLSGSIELELYPDYLEIQKEFSFLNQYRDKVLLAALNISELNTQKENWEEELRAAEKQWGQKKQAVDTGYDTKYQDYKTALLYKPERLAHTKGKLHEEEKEKQFFDNQYNQSKESLDVVYEKTEELAALFFTLEEEKAREPFKNPTKAIEEMAFITKSPRELNESLNNLQLMLKLSVDVHNKQKHHLKNSLRGIHAPDNHEKILNELVVYNNVFQQQTLSSIHFLNGYEQQTEDELDLLLSEVAVGLKENHQQKKQKTAEMYNVLKASSAVRRNKLKQTLEKDNARQGYHLLQTEKEKRANGD